MANVHAQVALPDHFEVDQRESVVEGGFRVAQPGLIVGLCECVRNAA